MTPSVICARGEAQSRQTHLLSRLFPLLRVHPSQPPDTVRLRVVQRMMPAALFGLIVADGAVEYRRIDQVRQLVALPIEIRRQTFAKGVP